MVKFFTKYIKSVKITYHKTYDNFVDKNFAYTRKVKQHVPYETLLINTVFSILKNRYFIAFFKVNKMDDSQTIKVLLTKV